MSYAGETPKYLQVAVNDMVYFGDPNTDGTYRIYNDGSSLRIQLRVAGAWEDKDVIE